MSKNIFSKTGDFVSNHPLATAAGALTTIHDIEKGKGVAGSLAKGAAVTAGVAAVPVVVKIAVTSVAVAVPIVALAAAGESIGRGLLYFLMTNKERDAHFKLDYCLKRYVNAKTKEDSAYWLNES